MPKKRFISSILLFAFAVIFAHSIIPHHHHEEERPAQHHGSHDDDHGDIDHDFLGQAFSHFQHAQGSGIVYETASPVYQYSKVDVDKDTYFLVQYIVQILHKPPLKHPESYPFIFSSSSYFVTSLLRGPPVSLA
ncbi:MAG: hypothetical protein ABI691_15320 [Ginsengibacter sp.]